MKTYSPEEVGMSTERLGRLAPALARFIQGNCLPGVMTLLQRKGKVVHFAKHGFQDIQNGQPMQEDAIFRIYSMTKPIVSVALLMLVEEGRVSLNDLVARYIPAFAKTKVYAGAGATGLKLVDQNPAMSLYHLITHTSGLSYGWFFDSPVEDLYRKLASEGVNRNGSLQHGIERLAQIPLLFQPGTQWRYSFAHDVLGYIIQIISDMPLADFLQDRIFKPLGMVDTGFSVPPEKANRLAPIYASKALYDPFPVPPDKVALGDVTQPTNFPSGGGGLTSTLADYLNFCNCLLNNGSFEGKRLLSRKTVAWMTANHIPETMLPIMMGEERRDHGYGLGVRVALDLGKMRSVSTPGEYGWGGLANTYFWIDPGEAFIGLMMTQHLPVEPYPVKEIFRNVAYQAIVD